MSPAIRFVGVHALAAVAVLGVAPPAAAATYYVRPTGSDANSGTSPSAAWATIGRANGAVLAGDVVVVYPGTYSQFPNPANSGTSYANRITFVGDLANPPSTVVPGGTLSRRHVTLKGFRFSGGITMGNQARYDSVAYSQVDGDTRWSGNKYCMIYRCRINGGRFNVGEKLGISTERDTLMECTLYLGNGVNSQPHAFDTYDFTQYCHFERNRIFITIPSGATDVHPRIHYHTQYCTFRDNYWSVTNNSSSTGWGTLVIRDSTSYNTFVRDTLIANGPGESRIYLASSGTFGNSCRDNQWHFCVFKNMVGDAATFQNPCWRLTFQNCIFIASRTALHIGWMTGPTLIDHCTFVGGSAGGVVNMDPDPDAPWSGTLTATNNIFYSTSTASGTGEVALFHLPLAFQTHLVENNNLFFHRGYSSSPGDRSIGWWTGGINYSSRPGTAGSWYQTYGHDGASRYGSPLFEDSTLAGFDGRLRPGSAAIGMGIGGTDVGAIPFAPLVDLIPPAAVSDLRPDLVFDVNVVLVWTAPGDDGNIGVSTAYDLRYSTAPISEANFAAATPVPVQPATLPAGSGQSYVLMGLTPDTDYYFALKTRDEAGNWSPISNVAQARTLATDTAPPAPVTDFTSGF